MHIAMYLYNYSVTRYKVFKVLKSKRIQWAGHFARMERKGNTYRVLVGKPEGKIPVKRPRSRW